MEAILPMTVYFGRTTTQVLSNIVNEIRNRKAEAMRSGRVFPLLFLIV
jgi:hypothetical protein